MLPQQAGEGGTEVRGMGKKHSRVKGEQRKRNRKAAERQQRRRKRVHAKQLLPSLPSSPSQSPAPAPHLPPLTSPRSKILRFSARDAASFACGCKMRGPHNANLISSPSNEDERRRERRRERGVKKVENNKGDTSDT